MLSPLVITDQARITKVQLCDGKAIFLTQKAVVEDRYFSETSITVAWVADSLTG